jgi:hypothetical protein
MLYKVLALWNNMEQYGTIQTRLMQGNSPGKSSPFAINYHHFVGEFCDPSPKILGHFLALLAPRTPPLSHQETIINLGLNPGIKNPG